MTDRVFFFGCWNEPGHFIRAPDNWVINYSELGRLSYYGDHIHLDGTLAPRLVRANTRTWNDRVAGLCWQGQGKTNEERQRIHYDSDEVPQGQFLLHRLCPPIPPTA